MKAPQSAGTFKIDETTQALKERLLERVYSNALINANKPQVISRNAQPERSIKQMHRLPVDEPQVVSRRSPLRYDFRKLKSRNRYRPPVDKPQVICRRSPQSSDPMKIKVLKMHRLPVDQPPVASRVTQFKPLINKNAIGTKREVETAIRASPSRQPMKSENQYSREMCVCHRAPPVLRRSAHAVTRNSSTVTNNGFVKACGKSMDDKVASPTETASPVSIVTECTTAASCRMDAIDSVSLMRTLSQSHAKDIANELFTKRLRDESLDRLSPFWYPQSRPLTINHDDIHGVIADVLRNVREETSEMLIVCDNAEMRNILCCNFGCWRIQGSVIDMPEKVPWD